MSLTMNEKCFVCRKEQKVGEHFTIIELEDCHISFCSKKCEKIHENYGKDMFNFGKRHTLMSQKEKGK